MLKRAPIFLSPAESPTKSRRGYHPDFDPQEPYTRLPTISATRDRKTTDALPEAEDEYIPSVPVSRRASVTPGLSGALIREMNAARTRSGLSIRSCLTSLYPRYAACCCSLPSIVIYDDGFAGIPGAKHKGPHPHLAPQTH